MISFPGLTSNPLTDIDEELDEHLQEFLGYFGREAPLVIEASLESTGLLQAAGSVRLTVNLVLADAISEIMARYNTRRDADSRNQCLLPSRSRGPAEPAPRAIALEGRRVSDQVPDSPALPLEATVTEATPAPLPNTALEQPAFDPGENQQHPAADVPAFLTSHPVLLDSDPPQIDTADLPSSTDSEVPSSDESTPHHTSQQTPPNPNALTFDAFDHLYPFLSHDDLSQYLPYYPTLPIMDMDLLHMPMTERVWPNFSWDELLAQAS